MRHERWVTTTVSADYEVSTLGQVRRATPGKNTRPGAMRKWVYGNDGYPRVGIGKKQHLVHRLVALAFLGQPPVAGMDVAHSDGDRGNPSLDNIRWATRAENNADKVLHGTHPYGARMPLAKIDAETAQIIRTSPESQPELSARFGIHQSQVSRIKSGRAWKEVACAH